MIRQNSVAKRTLAAFAPIFLLVALVAAPAEARDKEFGLLVHHLESTYHAKRSHRFLMGFAGLVVRVWRPYAVVMQMKINPDKLSESIDHRSHGCRQKPRENPDDTSHGSTDEPALHTVSEAAGT